MRQARDTPAAEIEEITMNNITGAGYGKWVVTRAEAEIAYELSRSVRAWRKAIENYADDLKWNLACVEANQIAGLRTVSVGNIEKKQAVVYAVSTAAHIVIGDDTCALYTRAASGEFRMRDVDVV